MAVANRRRSAVPRSVRNSSAHPSINSVKEGRSKKINLCVYGPPGIGKTRFIGTCAEAGPTLILRPPVDHTDSIVDHEVDEWVLHDWGEADDALLYLRNEGAEKYKGGWVWLDSLSLWQDQGLDDLWEKIIVEKPHRARWGLDKGDYHINMQRIGRWIRHMVGCPHWNFGVTCHPRVTESTEDEEDPVEKLMPWVQGKMMAPKVCGYMNVVGYMEWEKMRKRDVRVLHMNSTDKYYAKDQFSCFEDGRLINPTMPKLLDAISKGKNSSGAAATSNVTRTNRRRRAASGRK